MSISTDNITCNNWLSKELSCTNMLHVAQRTARQHQRYGCVNLLFQTLSEDFSFLLLLAYQRIRGFAFMRYINPRLTLTLTLTLTQTGYWFDNLVVNVQRRFCHSVALDFEPFSRSSKRAGRVFQLRLRLPSWTEFFNITVNEELRRLHSQYLWNTAASDVRGTIEQCTGKNTSCLLGFCTTPHKRYH